MAWRIYTLVTLILVLLASSAWGASISGTVINNTGKSGRIYVLLSTQYGTNHGTSIASAGNFTVNGVQSGESYTATAFVDTMGTGVQHANDPTGSSITVTATSGNVSVGSLTVTTPSAVPAQAPEVSVFPGTGANMVSWMDGPESPEGHPIADKYIVSWSNNSSGSPVAGSQEVPAGAYDFFIHSGGSAGLYYRVQAVNSASTASSPWTVGSASTATGSVTGKVYFPGVSESGPLHVVLVDFSDGAPKFVPASVSSPGSETTYTVTKVPNGTWEAVAYRDLNGNGTYDAGDVGWAENSDINPTVTVSGSSATVGDITLANGNYLATLSTDHGMSDGGDWYNLQFFVQSMKKRVVAARVTSGPQLSLPYDMATDWGQFEIWANVGRPTVGDTYQIALTYSDGTSETISRSVTGVLDAIPTPVGPVGYVPYQAAPTFSWTAPSPAPAEYVYNLWVSDADWNDVWDAWGIPGSTTSLLYGSRGEVNQSELTDGTTYNWTINLVDSDGNRAQRQVSFTPTTAPAMNGFTPRGGQAGTTVTISGVNFSTNPAAHTVLFNGVSATVGSATSTALTVTVPNGATTGKVQVNTQGRTLVSEDNFRVGAPRTVSGIVKTSSEVAIAGATVEVAELPGLSAVTAANGSFTLQPLFDGEYVTLKLSKTGFVPTYTTGYNLQGNLDYTPYPNHLYSAAELAAWGVTSGKGAVVGKVMVTGGSTPVEGAVVSASTNGVFYPVTYYSGTGTALGGSSTYANGLFFVLNVNNWDWVTVAASKSGWSFGNKGGNGRGASVTELGVFGSTSPPSIWNVTPLTGTAGSTVTITGSNFGSQAADNTVKFNGVTATVTSASAGSLTVTVPAGAGSGAVSVTTAGGTNSYGSYFTMQYTLSTTLLSSGSGAGSVNSVPSGLSCLTGNCTAVFDDGTEVELVAAAGTGSTLSSWGGACSGIGTCVVTMTQDRGVTATFAQLMYIKNGASYYSLLQSAFDAAADGNTIMAQSRLFTATSWSFNRSGVQAKLKGGYDGSFLNITDFTTLQGRLNLQNGTLRVEKVKLR